MREAFDALRSSLANQITRARHVLAGYSPTKARTMLQLKGRAGEVFQNVELILPYGLSAMPVGSSADYIVFQVNNTRDHKLAIGGDDPACRITDLQPGEFGLQDNQGQQIVLRRTGIVITTSLGVTMNSPFLHVTGAVIAGYGGGDQVGLQTHTHNQPADSHGDTEEPTNAPNAGT